MISIAAVISAHQPSDDAIPSQIAPVVRDPGHFPRPFAAFRLASKMIPSTKVNPAHPSRQLVYCPHDPRAGRRALRAMVPARAHVNLVAARDEPISVRKRARKPRLEADCKLASASDSLGIPFDHLRVLRRKCRQDGKTIGSFTTYNIDIAVTYPNVRVQTAPVVLRRAVIKHRRYSSSPQHQLCGKTLLKAQGAPWHSRCSGDDCPSNTPHLIQACLARKLRWTNWTCCQESDMTERQHSYGDSSDAQPKNRFH